MTEKNHKSIVQPYFYKKAVDVPLYGGKLVIVACNSITLLEKNKIKTFDSKEDIDIYAHMYYGSYKCKRGYYVILNFDNKISKISHGTISHEALHATFEILESINLEPHAFKQHETFAYLQGWVVDEIYKFMTKYKFNAINK